MPREAAGRRVLMCRRRRRGTHSPRRRPAPRTDHQTPKKPRMLGPSGGQVLSSHRKPGLPGLHRLFFSTRANDRPKSKALERPSRRGVQRHGTYAAALAPKLQRHTSTAGVADPRKVATYTIQQQLAAVSHHTTAACATTHQSSPSIITTIAGSTSNPASKMMPILYFTWM
jgi:hypothetical protein